MSLNGNLEDLPLLDILQVVSFSKKTGWLNVTTDAGKAGVVFRSGFIVAAYTWDLPPLDPRFEGLQASIRESLIRKRIEVAVEQLTWLRDGQFEFSLGEPAKQTLAGFDIGRESLEVGVNPQELLLEMARGMDEGRRDSWSAVEAPFSEPAPEAEAAAAAGAPAASEAPAAATAPETPAEQAFAPPRAVPSPWISPSAEAAFDVDAVLDQRIVEVANAGFAKPVVIRVATAQPSPEAEAEPEADAGLSDSALLADIARVAEQALPAKGWPADQLEGAESGQPLRPSRDLAPEYTALRDVLPEQTMPVAIPGVRIRQDTERFQRRPEPAAPVVEPPLSGTPEAPVLEGPAATPAAIAAIGQTPAAAPGAAEQIDALLLVDDEDDVRGVLAERFSQAGYRVVEAEDPDAALKKASLLSKAGIPFVLVVDLGMPTSGGSSFQGGFEVVKRLGKMKLHPPVLLMTEKLSPALRARAKQMRIESVVFKPGLSKLDPEQHREDLLAFANRLLTESLPQLSRRSQPQRATAEALRPAQGAGDDAARDLKVLQLHLAELRESPDVNRISTLVMRVAREFFERGLLLLVRNDEARGLGGFGPSGSGESLNKLVRQLVIPLAEAPLMADVVSSGKPWSGEPPEDSRSRAMLDSLGRGRSTRIALLPLVAHRDTIALLVGDNPESGRDLGRLEALELFMREAGSALENAVLQRKLRALREPG